MVKPFLKKNACFFPFLGEKLHNVDKKWQKGLILSQFNCPAKKFKFPRSPVKFSILVKAKMAATSEDGFTVGRWPLCICRRPQLEACNSHTKPMSRHFNRRVYFYITFSLEMSISSRLIRFCDE